MSKNVKVIYNKWSWGWGIFLLLAAALVLAHQFGGFTEIGIGSLIVAALAVALLVHCIVDLSFGAVPIPLAALYYVFQEPLGFPEINFWPLVLITLLATAGLFALIPRKRYFKKRKRSNIEVIFADSNGVTGPRKLNDEEAQVIEEGDDNNPRISVQFGSVSRYLHADALESAELDCNLGHLEVYFDNVKLSPNGAEVIANCKLGAIEMYMPSDWQIIDEVSASLGGVDVKGKHKACAPDAPKVRVTGNVSLGGMEIHRV